MFLATNKYNLQVTMDAGQQDFTTRDIGSGSAPRERQGGRLRALRTQAAAFLAAVSRRAESAAVD
ncbi:MAG: hypothetical protein IPH55_08800 [Betaproteobacteria bacterium]|nr:hypothetical protein [Betaproteobacteria bacterium]